MPASASRPEATGSVTPIARYAGLRARLPGARLPWLAKLRDDAARSFADQGFPTRRIEAWRFTDLRRLAETTFTEPLAAVDDALPAPIAPLGTATAVLVDGKSRADLSALGTLPKGMSVRGLAAALAEDAARLAPLLGSLAKPGAQPLAALNTALMEDGIVVHLGAGVRYQGRLHLAMLGGLNGGRSVAFHPRILVVLEDGAELALVETAAGAAGAQYLDNPVSEIFLGRGATLTHTRLQDLPRDATQIATTYVRVAEAATYENFVLALGAGLARNEIHTELAGPRAVCHLNGAQLLDGTRHADTTTAIDHAAPNCASRQTYKSVLAGKSRAVFQGRIHVHRVAQKTDGYQMNQALLLSSDAEMDSKPQLEIYADDVKCSHGATVGELDEGQLFYLRSRGIPAHTARALLVQAFLADALEHVSDEELREHLAQATTAWWHRVAETV
jgi:Fe-S cluster assembly protein SufD